VQTTINANITNIRGRVNGNPKKAAPRLAIRIPNKIPKIIGKANNNFLIIK
jgi:hypothetical protein